MASIILIPKVIIFFIDERMALYSHKIQQKTYQKTLNTRFLQVQPSITTAHIQVLTIGVLIITFKMLK